MAKAKTYELNDAVLAETKVSGKGQAQLIIRSLMNKSPQTAQQIADDIKDKLETRQDPLRVVSFYISTWKKAGLIQVAGVADEESPVSTEKPKSQPMPPATEDPVADDDLEELEDEADNVNDEEFDFVNASMSDAIVKVVSEFAEPSSPKFVSDELNVRGRTVSAKQVRDAIGKLVKAGRLDKVGDGVYAVPQAVAQ